MLTLLTRRSSRWFFPDCIGRNFSAPQNWTLFESQKKRCRGASAGIDTLKQYDQDDATTSNEAGTFSKRWGKIKLLTQRAEYQRIEFFSWDEYVEFTGYKSGP